MTTDSHMPEHLADERCAVEAEIRRAFKGVSRDGGISWSETKPIDDYGARPDSKLRLTARQADHERCWEDLVDDPAWNDESGAGGFCFLDPIGFRYYLAPAMIRHVRRADRGGLDFHLKIESDLYRARVDLMTAEQASAVARFIRLMIATYIAFGDEIGGRSWQQAYDSHWRKIDPDSRPV